MFAGLLRPHNKVKPFKQDSLILISSAQTTWLPMKSFMILQRGQTRGFPAVCCTLHQERRQHLDHSGPSHQLLLQLQHEPLYPDKPALLSSLLPSCTHRCTPSVWGSQASWARIKPDDTIMSCADTSTHTISLTKPNSFSAQHFGGEAGSQVLFSMASISFFFFF